MNINTSIKRRIKSFGIALSLVFGFMLLSGMDASAQIYRDDRRDDRQDRREERRERRGDRRDARQDGYREGLEEGREDARERRRFNPMGSRDYRRAGGEDTQRERQAFRQGFLQGYREAYYRNSRNRRGY